MLPNVPSSAGVESAPQGEHIRVAMMEERGRRRFTLTYRDETLVLENSASLNRWGATGIVRRHNVSLSSDGVVIDGRSISFSQADALEELERIFNEPQAPLHHPPVKHAATSDSTHPLPPPGELTQLAKLAESLHVTRDGFEFHVSYVTKYGDRKSDQLEKALEVLQQMRAFKPHVNIQKTGIRLAVTTWDGDQFREEAGIENLEHATPYEIEVLLKKNLLGTPESAATLAPAAASAAHRHVARLQLTRKGHEHRFHLVLHRGDGTTEEGPLLIRANLAKVHDLFQPEINLIITALNDRVIIEKTTQVDGQPVKQCESFPFETDEDAKKLETALNGCLKIKPESS